MKETICELLPWECEFCPAVFTPTDVLRGETNSMATCPQCRSDNFKPATEPIAKGNQ
jgi:hypothetical protein